MYFSLNTMHKILCGIGMEVWKIVFHSMPEIFHSIPFWQLPYSKPKFPFHFPFHSIPCPGSYHSYSDMSCDRQKAKQNNKKKQPLPLYLHAKTFRCCFLILVGGKKLSLLFHSFFIRVVTVKGYFQKQQLFTSGRNDDSKLSKCTVHCKH